MTEPVQIRYSKPEKSEARFQVIRSFAVRGHAGIVLSGKGEIDIYFFDGGFFWLYPDLSYVKFDGIGRW